VLSIPYTVLIVFTLNIVLLEVGAGDLSGAGAALASVTQVGPAPTASATPRPTSRTRRTRRGSRCWCRRHRRLIVPSSSDAALLEIALRVVVSAISQPWMQSRRWDGASCLVRVIDSALRAGPVWHFCALRAESMCTSALGESVIYVVVIDKYGAGTRDCY
jgi:hypothetical protein